MKKNRTSLQDELQQSASIDDPTEQLKLLQSLQRRFASELKADENAREELLTQIAGAQVDLGLWPEAEKTLRLRLAIVRPAARSNHGFALLVAEYLAAVRRGPKPLPYLCELLDQIRFIEDIGVEPAVVLALQQMVQLPDFKLCGKALYIFKKAARRYGVPDFPFTRASVEKLYVLYRGKYLTATKPRKQ